MITIHIDNKTNDLKSIVFIGFRKIREGVFDTVAENQKSNAVPARSELNAVGNGGLHAIEEEEAAEKH